MCLNTESIFTKIYAAKSKPFTVGILYRPPNKINCVICIDQIFSQVNTLEIWEYYLLGGFNINLLFKGRDLQQQDWKNSLYRNVASNKKKLESRFSNSLEQILTPSTRINDRAATLTDHILTNSSHKVSQSGVSGLSNHDLIFSTQKKLPIKFHKHKILVKLIKHDIIDFL